MKAYEAGNPAYFATPPVNLIYAYNASLKIITAQRHSTESNWPTEVITPLEERFVLHKTASEKIKAAAAELGLKQLPQVDEEAANGMSAVSTPIPRFSGAFLLIHSYLPRVLYRSSTTLKASEQPILFLDWPNAA